MYLNEANDSNISIDPTTKKNMVAGKDSAGLNRAIGLLTGNENEEAKELIDEFYKEKYPVEEVEED